jgi:acyl carrier protein
MSTLRETIVAIVANVTEIEQSEVRAGESLKDLGVDSLMGLEIAVHIERAFDVRFDDDELGQIESFEDLVNLTQGRLDMAREAS